MRSITGVFPDLEQATRACHELQDFVPKEALNLLSPSSSHEDVQAVPHDEVMAPVAGPMGAVLGGALGVGIGVLLPGVGQITALGVALATLLGASGGVAGWKVGDTIDRRTSEGIPVDELYLYEDALRRGRSVLIVLLEDPHREHEVREVLERLGAESVDAARESWWLGVRDAEKSAYHGGEFDAHEAPYRAGFETAHDVSLSHLRSFDDARTLLRERHPDHYSHPAFRRGFERGRLRRDAQDETVRETQSRQSAGGARD